MKKCLMFLMCICVSGCLYAGTVDGKTSDLVTQVKTLNVQLDKYQDATKSLVEALKISGVDPNLFSQFDTVGKAIDSAQLSAMQSAEQADRQMWEVVIEALRAGNKETVGKNPYAGVIESVLVIIGSILAVLWRKKASDAATAIETAEAYAVKYQAHKQGVESVRAALVASGKPEIAKVSQDLYEAIGKAREVLGVTKQV